MGASPQRVALEAGRRARRAWCLVAGAILAVAGTSCSPQPLELKAVMPDTGYPRQLLEVDGATLYASVVWDAGLSTEQEIYNGLFGTSYFQIPEKATPGPHPVAIRNNLGTSATKQVTVLASQGVFPAPRIEDIGVLLAGGNGPVDLGLTIAAANLDLNATVTAVELVGGTPVARKVRTVVTWGGLPIDYLQHHKPDTFGYPVYHYAQLLSVVEGVGLGSTLHVTVTNTDNESSTKDLPVPVSLDQLDGDQDGLIDSWEEGSYTAVSGNTVPLKQMGANKWRKDILVEVDWMAAAAPQASLWQKIEQAFKDAPVLNPDGSRGVNIIIDHGQGGWAADGGQLLTDRDCLSMKAPPAGGWPGCASSEGFFNYKAGHFNVDRLHIFHYAILGQKHPDHRSGDGERHGNDFLVTLGEFPAAEAQDANVQLGLFMHELGHNLGFSHGDLVSEDQNYALKPNLPSVMTYSNGSAAYGADVDCNMTPDGVYTYSQGTLKPINEAHVDETIGICDGIPADMNYISVGGLSFGPGDGTISTAALDVNGDGDTLDTSDDFDQWGNMLLPFDTPGSKWANN